MKFSKEEKKFWQTFYHFDKPSQLPENWLQIRSANGNENDEFFYFFTLRFTSITDVYLKESQISDEAVKLMAKFEHLNNLYLRRHKNITKESIAYFNQMKHLEQLNITKTNITLSDLCEYLNNQSLKEVFLDSEENETNIEEKGFILKERMPNCTIYLDCSEGTDSF